MGQGLWLILIALCLASGRFTHAQDEARILQELRGNLSDPRGILSDWRSSTSFCTWSGITCGNSSVVEIRLGRKALEGVISPAIGLLRRLRVLDLSKNNITGPIPGEITGCAALTDINLGDNSLVGVIPEDIGRLRFLTSIRLGNNRLQGPIPASIGQLSFLRRLKADGNQINGSIPFSIGNCSQLQYLQLYNNQLRGSIPAQVGNLRRLTHLSLFANQMSGELPEELGRSVSLSRLSLAANNFSGPIPASLGNLTGLFELDISRNKFSEQLPPGLGSAWTQLDTLNMSGNRLSGPWPAGFAQMSVIRLLDLSLNALTGQLLLNSSHLEQVVVSGNHLSGSVPAGLCRGNLTLLDLSGNRMSGSVGLDSCVSLQYVNASNNNFNGSFPLLATSAGSLTVLDFTGNQLQGPIPARVDLLGELRSLLLSGNQLSGPLPQGIGLLPLLRELDVSRNSLTGELPNLASLTSLHTLDLSQNSLTGSIPQYFATFLDLETLDLSRNQFSGSIPPALAQLRNLERYNFSNNQLSGQIPQMKASMPASAFSNNLNLCGPPLAQPCVTSPPAAPVPPSPPRRSNRMSAARKLGVAFLVIGGSLLALTGIFLLYTYVAMRGGSKPVVKPAENKFADRVPLLYAEIEKATEGFSDSNVIGAGPHGAVYKGIFAWEKILAVKVIRSEQDLPESGESNNNAYYYTAAARKLSRIRHPNLVKLEEFVIYKGVKIFLNEYMPNKSLGEQLHRPSGPKLHWNTRYKIALGAAQGLSYLHHQQSIVHCDIKASNVLLDSAFGARISDIGLAKLIKDTRSLSCVNKALGYSAPEPVKVSAKADVFSFGVVLLELLTGRHPVLEDGTLLGSWVRGCLADEQPLCDIVDPILRNVNGPFQEEMSSVCKVALICTDPSPIRRPSMKQVVEVLSRIRKEPGGPKLRSLRSFIHRRSFVLVNTQDDDQL